MKNLLKVFVAIDLILINALLGFLIYKNEFKLTDEDSNIERLQEISSQNEESKDECGEECKRYIELKVSELTLDTKEVISSTPTPRLVPTKKSRRTYYVPIPGSGSTLATDWTNLSGTDFYLSKNDFPGLLEVYFEANIKLLNANGKAFFRIYDTTHFIGVGGSQIETTSQTSVFVSSGKVSLWEGYNHYIVQAKTLTADTAVYESGKLKIITEE
ncbi:MAG: hypothetical protein UT24_C0009G0082 [Candidatus Woesebacteria bacterium GW2011_GWB1_39_12]|uniref:Uncharacterized protein n=2 Tax=Candidatus Woeseibacteriota TaxID=1752722 RepID=A0A0G0M5W5_9BACT|nr:MAG: hypothetical protein UT23_C0002G0082 [Candidatus Woesebacteria bacterium GW2011_GWA1_39_12]KKR00765.1 MAG: hypothetical protein UT24_C0009G0082 [Candidatus Woesebacteria bacterium GW2011_GWB1_39_12]